MKKYYLLFGCFLSFCVNLSSQTVQDTSSTPYYSRSAGISATFINNFLPIDNAIGLTSFYPFHFIEHSSEDRFRKHALDFNVSASLENNVDTDEVDNILLNPEYKFAWGRKVSLFDKGQLYFGPELLINPEYNYRSSTNNFGFSEILSVDRTIGLSMFMGPMIGLEYQIGNRFSIYAEAGFYVGLGYSHRRSIDKDIVTEEETIQFTERTLGFSNLNRFPRSIILFYHF